jgi:hypothetical protein
MQVYKIGLNTVQRFVNTIIYKINNAYLEKLKECGK